MRCGNVGVVVHCNVHRHPVSTSCSTCCCCLCLTVAALKDMRIVLLLTSPKLAS
jgi:hypothetical protein